MEKLKIELYKNFFSDWIYDNYLKKTEIVSAEEGVLTFSYVEKEIKDYLMSLEHILIEKFVQESNLIITKIAFEEKIEEKKFLVLKIDANLLPQHTFDNFQVGPSNDNAFTMARQLSVDPLGTNSNSLFIYGGSGLGKTHLLHAIGNEIDERHKELTIMYLPANKFIDDFFKAYDKSSEEVEILKQKILSVDVLLMDDVQMFNKGHLTSIWAELFNILESAYRNNKQVVFASDKPAKDFNFIEERIVSRMNWGRVVTITPPGYGLRREILKKKIINNDYYGINDDVIDYIASHVTSNVRELEGALTTLISQSVMFQSPEVSLEDAKQWISHLTSGSSKDIDVNKIKQLVCDKFAIPVHEIDGTSRKKEIVQARNIAIHLCYEELKLSKNSIGGYFGGKDHSTIMHSLRKINTDMTSNMELYEKVQQIKEALNK